MRILKRNLPASSIFAIAAVACTMYSMSVSFLQTQKNSDNKLQIVATTTMLFDLTSEIAGDIAYVTGLMGAGIDPHLYQASAGDVTKMQAADVVVYTGLHLEGRMGDVFRSLEKLGRTVICVADGIAESKLIRDAESSQFDPHIWFDASLWKDAAHEVAKGLCAADVENSSAYNENLEAYLSQLDDLEQYITQRISELDESRRVLITAHDAFKYFGRAYGFEVLGLCGINTGSEAGTADVSTLARIIAEREIHAVFIETSVPPKNIEALTAAVRAHGFFTTPGGELHSDSLGGSGSGCDTYIKAFRANVDTIVDALNEGAA